MPFCYSFLFRSTSWGIVYSQLKHSIADMQLMFDVLERSPEIEDRPNAIQLDIGDGELRFDRVSFAYDPERPIPARHQLRGSRPDTRSRWWARVVPANPRWRALLFRFYDVESGCILINGQDVRAVTQQSLRAAIGIVPQDTVLFNDTPLPQHRLRASRLQSGTN